MGILNIQTVQAGLVGTLPSLAYINTSDTFAEVTATGYLNKEIANGLQISLPCIAVVSTQPSPTAAQEVNWYQVNHVGANWSLDADAAGTIKFMGQYTTLGGAASEAITITGAVAATDRAFVQLVDDGPNNVSVLSAVVTANTLTITYSANPGAGTIVNYQLIRAAS